MLLNLLPPSNKQYWNQKLAKKTAKSILKWSGGYRSDEIDCFFLIGRKVINVFADPGEKVAFGEWITVPTIPPLGYKKVSCSFIDALCLPHPSRLTKEKFESWTKSLPA